MQSQHEIATLYNLDMTEEVDFAAKQADYKCQEGEAACLSQPSTQEGSHKASFDGLQDWKAIAPQAVLREMAFPTGRLCQQLSQRSQKDHSAFYQPLSDSATSRVLLNLAHLREVLETLEEELEPVDLRTRKALKKPAILVGVPAASTLLRSRKPR